MRIRTGYSFRTAIGKLPDVMSRVKDLGWSAAPICDRNSTFGHNRWRLLCEMEKIRPVYGVELAVVPRLGDKKPIADFWSFFAIDDVRSINELVSLATSNPGREPSLLYSQARSASGVVKIAGERCLIDNLSASDPDLFLSLDPSTPRGLYLEAKRRGFRFVASSCNFYPRESDKELYRVTLGFRSGTQTYPMHILTDDEWRDVTWFVDEDDQVTAIHNRNQLIDRCQAKMLQGTLLVPPKEKTLRRMCEDGAVKRLIDLSDPIYGERLDRELKLIAEKNFEDYFYIVSDLIRWAKTKMIVGPARGSSCGSLVCYLLEITAVDPIPYDLVFERFIDTTRADFPDVDIDFSDARRHLIFDYMEEKYGKDRVARLGTVSMFQSKSALNQVGAALKIPKWMVEKVSDSVIRRSKGDSRADLKVEDTLRETDAGKEMMAAFPEAEIVGRMEDHPSNAGQHAAGVILTNDPVIKYVAVDSRNNTAMCDWQDAKDLNLLKLDALGLTQLSIFERTMELAGLPQTSDFLESLPLDDPRAFKVLNDRHFSGIFQFTGPTLQQICIEVEVTEFEDIVAMTALCRPGPIGSGGTRSWIERKNQRQSITVPHPIFEPYTKTSLGIVIYQEQVMRIGREVGGLSWADVTVLRKSMSKSMGKEFFDKYGDPWKREAIRKGVPEAVASDFWDDMCSFGMYGFNRSHAVAYALVSYWACWLKAHYPVEFAAATLDAEREPTRQLQILREMNHEGVGYVPVDPEVSSDRWQVTERDGKKILVGPLTQIKGIGPAAVREILDNRKNKTQVRAALKKRLETARTSIDSLYPITDAIKRLHPDLGAIKIVTPPTPLMEVQPGEVDGDVVVLAVLVRLYPLDENEPGRVAKRGRKVDGPTASVNFFVRDDTGDVFCKISRFDYQRLAPILMNDSKQGKTLFAIKGNVPKDFRMIWVKQIKKIGEMEL